eukprot:scaffold563_cov410-Prasinococcus_capsulatus_cf.AAC.3
MLRAQRQTGSCPTNEHRHGTQQHSGAIVARRLGLCGHSTRSLGCRYHIAAREDGTTRGQDVSQISCREVSSVLRRLALKDQRPYRAHISETWRARLPGRQQQDSAPTPQQPQARGTLPPPGAAPLRRGCAFPPWASERGAARAARPRLRRPHRECCRALGRASMPRSVVVGGPALRMPAADGAAGH